MRPIITVTAVVLLHLCVIAVLVGVNGCRSTSGFEKPGDTAAFSAGARPVGSSSLVVPPVSVVTATPAPVVAEAVRAVGPGGKRTIVKGETLTSVSLQEKVSRADLAKANGLGLNAVLKIGQVLTIPSASPKSASKPAVKAAPKAAAPAAPAPTFAPLNLVPLTGNKPAPAPAAVPAAPDKK
jgi:LysM repeat protein